LSVWDRLVGQQETVSLLTRAVAQPAAMTHAWLLTGPPGSGRSTAALAFAAALHCPQGGCGDCPTCHSVLAGSHPDVEQVRTETLSIGVDEARALVGRAARRPQAGAWHVIIVEDADRLTEQAVDALLKAMEEPPPATVWLLCAPSPQDVLPTVRSRTRQVRLRTPPLDAVAAHLVAHDGIDPPMAAFAARAAGGHIGRARWLARDGQARVRRADVLRLPTAVDGVTTAVLAAASLVDAAAQEAAAVSAELDGPEREALAVALGQGTTGARGLSASAQAALAELDRQQRRRATRAKRDALDRALVDLASFYRDVLVVQLGASVPVTNTDVAPAIDQMAARETPEATLRRLEAVLAARTALESNVSPQLALEAMAVRLRVPAA
jgi:DNA polymerase-3 subunit delta'